MPVFKVEQQSFLMVLNVTVQKEKNQGNMTADLLR